MSWWESAYRRGHVNWDPGEYDGHLPWLIDTFDIQPCRAIDVGCGSGKSAVWLAGRGFDVVGVDLAPTAVRLARELAGRRGVSAAFIHGSFPEDFRFGDTGAGVEEGHRLLRRHSFGLAIERGFLQHLSGKALGQTLRAVRDLLAPDGYFYSLIAAADGNGGYWGPRRWTRDEVRAAVDPYFRIEELMRSVFTPGEKGSMAAWVTVMRPLDPRSEADPEGPAGRQRG